MVISMFDWVNSGRKLQSFNLCFECSEEVVTGTGFSGVIKIVAFVLVPRGGGNNSDLHARRLPKESFT